MSELNKAIDTFLPERTVKRHPTDRPWITSKIKSSINKRQTSFLRHGKDSVIYKYRRNKVQRETKAARYHYYQNKVADVQNTNPKTWWKQIKNLSGLTTHTEWYHQFLEDSVDIKTFIAFAECLQVLVINLQDIYRFPLLHLQDIYRLPLLHLQDIYRLPLLHLQDIYRFS